MSRLAWTLALAALLLVPLARAQPEGVSYVQGGEPGITILLDEQDLVGAADKSGALRVDPANSMNISIALAPPQGVTWELRETRVMLLLQGPGSTPPASLVKSTSTSASIPPGFTVYVNRTFDLAALKPLGAGLFLMRVEVVDAGEAALYSREFYVHVVGNPFYTLAGLTASAVTLATGYGLWHIVQDVKEAYKARQRHKKKEGESKLAKYAAMGVSLESGLEGAVDVAGDLDHVADGLSKRRPVAWAATGLGLGGVGVSWAQFLGFIAVDIGQTLVGAAAIGATMLTACLLVIALQGRLKRRIEAARTRRVPVAEGSTSASAPEIKEG